MTLIIQQHVLWFEVSVDDPLLVEMLQALNDLSSVVAGPRLAQPRVLLIHVINVIPGGCLDAYFNNHALRLSVLLLFTLAFKDEA